MTEQVGNPNGIGLHEATLAISKMLGPEEDNQGETEALDPETGEAEEDYEGEVEAEAAADHAELADGLRLDQIDELRRHRVEPVHEGFAEEGARAAGGGDHRLDVGGRSSRR